MATRYPGLKAHISAAEINRWNESADSANDAFASGQKSPPLPSSPHWLKVRNDSGADRDRWECLALDETTWTLNDQTDVIYKGITADPDLHPAILLEPIAAGAIGRCAVHGVTLAWVSAALAWEIVAADPANHRLATAAKSNIRVLQTGAGGVRIAPVVLGWWQDASFESYLVQTPFGGIPAAVGTTFGQALCNILDELGNTTGLQVQCTNIDILAIPGSRICKANRILFPSSAFLYVIDVPH